MYCCKCKTELTNENKYCDTHGICKSCKKEYSKKTYNKNKQHKLKTMKKYSLTDNGKNSLNKSSKKMRLKYPEKWEARTKLREAVRKGEIIKPDKCEMDKIVDSLIYCHGKIEGHHTLGYTGEHWKDVLWLCQAHHIEYHTKHLV